MSIESEALAPDELSLLDLFGPDASPRAQNIVQKAAERSMDEMATVINAAGEADSEAEYILDSGLAVPQSERVRKAADRLMADIQAGIKIDPMSLDLLNYLTDNSINWSSGTSEDEGWTSIDAEWVSMLGKLTSVEEPKYVTSFPYSVGSKHGIISPNSTSYNKFFDTANLAAKDSILAQLAKQLTVAMAEGVDLTKINVALNLQNSSTGRIEPINIHAELDTEPSDRKHFSTAGLSGRLIK